MPKAQVNGIEIAYEVQGALDKPVVLLIHGLSMSIAAWPPELLRALRDAGFTLVMLDNRDMGHSQEFTEQGVPNLALQMLKNKFRLPIKTVYRLEDMAQDAVSLLDELNIEQAHVLGVSMGGMISQLIAIHHSQRLLSLTSIMSTTGKRGLPGPQKEVMQHLLRKPASNAMDDILAHSAKTWELIGSPAYPTDQADIKIFVKGLLERGMKRAGTARQMLAIMASVNRHTQLKNVPLPSLVIHGKADPLVPVECGIDTADAIPDAKLELIAGMGHNFPVELMPQITQRVIEHLHESAPA